MLAESNKTMQTYLQFAVIWPLIDQTSAYTFPRHNNKFYQLP